jgi:hypothetical protein
MNVWLFTRYLLALLLWLPVTPAFAEATSTEIEFWQSVKDSGDAEMLEAYLQEFPDGEFTELANIKIRKLSGATEVDYLWCATKSAVIKQTKASCNQLGGKSFDNKDSALDEKHRRNQVGSQAEVNKNDPYFKELVWCVSDAKISHVARHYCYESLDGTAYSSEAQALEAQVPENGTSTLPRMGWCGLVKQALEISSSECIERNGIPVPTRNYAEKMDSFFAEWKTHKAVAMGADTYGFSGWADDVAEAQQRALLDCGMTSEQPTTCRLVNVNGKSASKTDYRLLSNSALSGSGEKSDLVGRYSVKLQNSEAVMADYLKVFVSGENISGEARICFNDSRCALYKFRETQADKRGRYFSAMMSPDLNPGGRWPDWTIKIAFSKNSDTVIGIFGRWIFTGDRVD